MQKKKYLFGLIVAVIFLTVFLDGSKNVKAAECSCRCASGDRMAPVNITSMTPNIPDEGDCDEACLNKGMTLYCCGSCSVYWDAVSPNDKQWCCSAAPSSCFEVNTGTSSCSRYGMMDVVQKKCSAIEGCSQYSGSTGSSGSSGNSGTSTGVGSTTSTTFINPIKWTSIDQVLTSLLTALSGLVVTLAIIFIVIGGILYMMSAGDPGMIKRAKDCWTGAVIGLAIVIAAPTFLKQVQEILTPASTLPDGTGKIATALTVSQIATNVLNFLLSITGIIAIISLVIAGGIYMTAYGDSTRLETAKKTGTWAIIGIVVALVSLIAVQQVSKLITG